MLSERREAGNRSRARATVRVFDASGLNEVAPQWHLARPRPTTTAADAVRQILDVPVIVRSGLEAVPVVAPPQGQ